MMLRLSCKLLFFFLWSCLLITLTMFYPVQYYLLQSPLATMTFGTFFRAQALVTGAQEALLLTKACEIGIFDVIVDLTREREATMGVMDVDDSNSIFRFASSWWSSQQRHPSSCPSLSSINEQLRKRMEEGGGKYSVSGKSLLTLMEALSAVGLVSACPEDVQTYRLTPIALQYFARETSREDFLCDMATVVNDRLVVNYLLDAYNINAQSPTMEKGKKKNSGESLLRNTVPVVDKEEGGGHDEEMTEETRLWRKFSERTGVYQQRASLLVAEGVMEALHDKELQEVEEDSKHGAKQTTEAMGERKQSGTNIVAGLHLADIGCGSGQQLLTMAKYIPFCDITPAKKKKKNSLPGTQQGKGSSPHDVLPASTLSDGVNGKFCIRRAVQFDLPEVISSLNKSEEATTQSSHLEYMGGSVFEADSIDRLVKTILFQKNTDNDHGGEEDEEHGQLTTKEDVTIIFMNSFLQHFDFDTCISILRRLQTSVQRHRRENVEKGFGRPTTVYLAVTELVVHRRGQYSPSVELVPMSQLFNFVLDAMTSGGSVRTSQEYIDLLSVIVMEGEKVNVNSLFPFPASVFLTKL